MISVSVSTRMADPPRASTKGAIRLRSTLFGSALATGSFCAARRSGVISARAPSADSPATTKIRISFTMSVHGVTVMSIAPPNQ